MSENILEPYLMKCHSCEEEFDLNCGGHHHNEADDYEWIHENLYDNISAKELKGLLQDKSFCCQECEIAHAR